MNWPDVIVAKWGRQTNRVDRIERKCYKSYVPVFLEKIVLPILATAVITVILLNPFRLDRPQRISLLVIVLATGYLIGHTLHKQKLESAKPPAPAIEAPRKSGDATTSGSNSPANTGNGNTSNNDQSSLPKK